MNDDNDNRIAKVLEAMTLLGKLVKDLDPKYGDDGQAILHSRELATLAAALRDECREYHP